MVDEDGEWILSEVSTTDIVNHRKPYEETTEPINRFNYWYHWAIYEISEEGMKPIYPTESTPTPTYLDKERIKFYNEIQLEPEDRFKVFVSLLKKHPEDITNPRVAKYFNELREYAEKFPYELRNYPTELHESARKDPSKIIEYAEKNPKEKLFQHYYNQALTALSGDKRGKKDLKEIINKDIYRFEVFMEYRTKGITVEKAIENTADDTYTSEDTILKVYKSYNKAYRHLLKALGNHDDVMECMKIMASDIMESSASWDNKLLVRIK